MPFIPPLNSAVPDATFAQKIRASPNTTRIRSTGKCRDPRTKTWSIGIIMAAARNTTSALLRELKQINRTAIATKTATIGLKTV